MAVSLYELHRPREATVTVSLAPDFSGDYVAPAVADDVTINAAIVEAVALGGGEVVLLHGDYQLTATVNVPANVLFRGVGWETVLNYNAGGNCITITGDNVKIRDLKIDIVAGAGAGGTRPNCILADTRANLEITKVWLIGDETVGDDGSDVRQCGIVFDTVTFSRVALIRSDDHMRHGIFLSVSDDNTLVGNTCQGNTRNGIILLSSDGNTLSGNTCSGNTQYGIILGSTSDDNTLVGNTCSGNGLHGIFLSTSDDNTLVGNTCQGNTRNGIILLSSDGNTLSGNTCSGNTEHGIILGSSDGNTVTGNTCFQNVRHGILLDTSSDNTIVGNTCNENDSGDSGTYDGIQLNDNADDNLVMRNICNLNDRYGINIVAATEERNWIKNNILRGNTAGAINDQGTDTKLPEILRGVLDPDTNIGTHPATNLPDEADTTLRFQILVPMEYQELVRAQIIVVQTVTPASPDMQWSTVTNMGKICSDQAYNVRTDAETDQTTAITQNDLECIDVSASLDGIVAGDLIGFTFIRRATQAGDTINGIAYFLGLRFTYV